MCLKTLHLMKLWQGWHNTGQDRPYFHYSPLGSQGSIQDFLFGGKSIQKKNFRATQQGEKIF